jgi:divalent metal cation (Fe/Co/Zn/Cd) transporter
VPDRSPLRAAIRISGLSLAVAIVLGTLAIVLTVDSGSLALAAFGLESLVDGAASGVLVWRFRTEHRDPERGEDIERTARRLVGLVLFMVAAYLGAASVRSLVVGAARHDSVGSIVLSAVSVLLLPSIANRKLVLARQLQSRALRADGLLTAVAAVLAAVTLAAVAVNRYARVTVADPSASLLMAVVLLRESLAALKR